MPSWSTDWMDRAACTGLELELFFPLRAKGRATNTEALEVCASCPVVLACLEYAMRTEAGLPEGMRCGVYGGLGPGQRAELERAARRAA